MTDRARPGVTRSMMPAVARRDTRPRSGGPRWHPSLTAEQLSEHIERVDVVLGCGGEIGTDGGERPGGREGLEASAHLGMDVDHAYRGLWWTQLWMDMPLAETSCPVCGVTSSKSTPLKSNSGQPEPNKHRYWSHGRVVSGVAQIPAAPRISSTRRPRG